ncbi:MAG: hypothetical protein ACI4AK_04795 [Lepagella sp.]
MRLKKILIVAVALLACVGMANARGYRGAVDLGLGLARHGECHFEASTTHGYVVNKYLFVGGGIGLHYYWDVEGLAMPIYADVEGRYNLGVVTTFLDMRLGYSPDIDGIAGVYFSPVAGVKWKRFTAGLGYTLQRMKNPYRPADPRGLDGFTIRLGVEF